MTLIKRNPLYRWRRSSSWRKRQPEYEPGERSKRLVHKDGECNIEHANIRRRNLRFMTDFFTTMVDIQWRYLILCFVLSFVLSWLLFGVVWFLIALAHKDTHLKDDPNHKMCVDNVYDFPTAFLFSIETQHTIGYGGRAATPNCPEAVLLLILQACFGVIVQTFMAGVIFCKLSRPKHRAATIMFSKNAVICRRDGVLCLLVRVADMRKSHFVGATIRACLVKKKTTLEGEVLPIYQHKVDFGLEDGDNSMLLVWPRCLVHNITCEKSPFWTMSADQLARERFELVLILEGTIESTGMYAQVRTSYIPGEILWGSRYERLVTYHRGGGRRGQGGKYVIDYTRFHSTVKVDTPRYSAKVLRRMRELGEDAVDHHSMEDSELDDDDVQNTVTSTGTNLGVVWQRMRDLENDLPLPPPEGVVETITLPQHAPVHQGSGGGPTDVTMTSSSSGRSSPVGPTDVTMTSSSSGRSSPVDQ